MGFAKRRFTVQTIVTALPSRHQACFPLSAVRREFRVPGKTGWRHWLTKHLVRFCYSRQPLQPDPRGYTTEDLVNATDDGILISGRGSWSIDQQRYNFQFSGQMFWQIKNGRVVGPLKDVGYQANTETFWRSCDMVGGPGTYRLFGTYSDGKGEPGQSNAVSHGCPPARFRVNVVNTRGGQG